MLFVKYFIILIIFVLSFLVGKIVSQKYRARVDELEEMKNALNVFKSKVRFTYEPIPEVFRQIGNGMNNNIGNLFLNSSEKMKDKTASDSWEEAVDEYNGNLNDEDKHVAKMLSKLLRNY